MNVEELCKDLKRRNEVLHHKNGEIVPIAGNIYQVILYAEPKRKIFTTSIEKAYAILIDSTKYETASNEDVKRLILA